MISFCWIRRAIVSSICNSFNNSLKLTLTMGVVHYSCMGKGFLWRRPTLSLFLTCRNYVGYTRNSKEPIFYGKCNTSTIRSLPLFGNTLLDFHGKILTVLQDNTLLDFHWKIFATAQGIKLSDFLWKILFTSYRNIWMLDFLMKILVAS